MDYREHTVAIETVHQHPYVSTAAPATTPEDITTTTGVSLSGGVILIAIIVIIIIIVRKRHSQDQQDQDELEELDFDEDDPEKMQLWLFGGRMPQFDVTQCIMDVQLLEAVQSVIINVSQLTLSRQLGKGQFGAVYEAKMVAVGSNPRDNSGKGSYERVAVKTLKGSTMATDEVEAFLREGILMKDFSHPHVLGLVGVAFGDHGVPMIILPFMANGNLRDFITKQDITLSVWTIINFGYMVAQGMAYLANQKFVHRDLATRNCMLDEDLCVKVADFGLSRDIYTREYYASNDREAKLPVKWMALESLMSGLYTTKSDVWAFGVLLWELMTRGVTPYPDVANWDMRNYISAGRRMAKPDMCPDEIYDLMLRCWQEDPVNRPSFEELSKELDNTLYDDDGDTRASGGDYYVNIEVAQT